MNVEVLHWWPRFKAWVWRWTGAIVAACAAAMFYHDENWGAAVWALICVVNAMAIVRKDDHLAAYRELTKRMLQDMRAMKDELK